MRMPRGIISIFYVDVDRRPWSHRRRRHGDMVLGGNLANPMFDVSSFPAEQDSGRRVRTVTLAPPMWQRADNARSSFASSEAS